VPSLNVTLVLLVRTLPDVAGRVSVVDPAMAGATNETLPLVSPEIITLDII